MGLSQLHILSLSLSLSRVLLPLKKLRLLLLPCPSISSLHPISVPHLLTTEGFLKDQIVLILFKVSIKQIPNFCVIVLFPFFFLNC